MTIITLLTDFGTSDSYVAETKAVLLAGAPGVTLVDVTHEVPPGDIQAAQYLLGRTWRRFLDGSVHLVVVDPGVGTERRAVAVLASGHLFVGPDNGVLTPVLEDVTLAVELSVAETASATFHGRDVFAPAAARLAAGEPLESLGSVVGDLIKRPLPRCRRSRREWTGEVIYIDRFGTLVTNLPGEALRGVTTVELAGHHRARVARTFGDVAPGELVAYVGSNDEVEVAARDRSAAQMTGLGVGAEVGVVGGRDG